MVRRHLTFLSIFLCFLLSTTTVFSLSNMSLSQNKGFSEVGKKAIPATVFIEGQLTKNKQQRSPSHFDDFNLFHQEFLKRFFGDVKTEDFPSPHKLFPLGSGFLIKPNGYLITNYHVIRELENLTVSLNDGRKFDAQLIGADESTDLAVLKIEGDQFPYLNFGSSQNLEIGEWAIAVGSPLGMDISLTVGVISGKGRRLNEMSSRQRTLHDFIQTDAVINPGNSGGPLLNVDGDVIGINTAIRVTRDGGYVGMSFAIPSDLAKIVTDRIIEKGSFKRSYMGVYLQPITQELAQSFKLSHTQGALVADVVKGSPAEAGGIMRGDIITQIDGKTMSDVYSTELTIALTEPETTTTLSLLRQGKPIQVKVQVKEHIDASYKQNDQQTIDSLGMKVETITPEIARQFRYDPNQTGVVITEVAPGSPAAFAGLMPGIIILSLNHEEITTSEAFEEILTHSPVKRYLMLIKKGKFTSFLSINLE